jgi:hypothetical protein
VQEWRRRSEQHAFRTMRANIEFVGAEAVDIPIAEVNEPAT